MNRGEQEYYGYYPHGQQTFHPTRYHQTQHNYCSRQQQPFHVEYRAESFIPVSPPNVPMAGPSLTEDGKHFVAGNMYCNVPPPTLIAGQHPILASLSQDVMEAHASYYAGYARSYPDVPVYYHPRVGHQPRASAASCKSSYESAFERTVSPFPASPPFAAVDFKTPSGSKSPELRNTSHKEVFVSADTWSIAEQYFHLDQGNMSLSSSEMSMVLGMVDTSASASGSNSYGPTSMVSLDTLSASIGSGHSRHAVTNGQSSRETQVQRPSSRSSNRSRGSGSNSGKQRAPKTLMHVVNMRLVSQYARQEQDSRFLQQQLRTASRREKQLALDQIVNELVDLSCNDFGNYVVQKFLEYGSTEQRSQITSKLLTECEMLSMDQYGCRVIQKALEFSDLHAKLDVWAEVQKHLRRFIEDEHGNHVVQKCVVEIPSDMLAPIYDLFEGKIVNFCVRMYGCRVVQRLLANAAPEFRDRMTNDILKEGIRLAEDTWGNYVIQFIIENGRRDVSHQIVEMLTEHFETLSYHKLASNVVEKCLEFATSSTIDEFIKVLLNRTNDELVEFITHEYGNYVVQTLVERANFKQGAYKIHKRLKRYGLMQRIKAETSGRRVAAKLDEKSGQYQKSCNRSDMHSRRI